MTLTEQVRQYALDHYSEDFAWSVIVECYTDSELFDLIAGYHVTTLDGFIEAYGPVVEVYQDRIADGVNSAF